jgi:hypothetical protein
MANQVNDLHRMSLLHHPRPVRLGVGRARSRGEPPGAAHPASLLLERLRIQSRLSLLGRQVDVIGLQERAVAVTDVPDAVDVVDGRRKRNRRN